MRFFVRTRYLETAETGQQAGNGDMVLIDIPIGQDQDIIAVPISAIYLQEQPVDSLFQTGIFIIRNRNHPGMETRLVKMTQL